MPDLLTVTRDIEAAPPPHWRYTVPETGVTLVDKWARDLRTQVLRHMEANGIPLPDDFEQRFADAACRESGLGSPFCGKLRVAEKALGVVEHLTWGHVKQFLRAVKQAILDRSFVPREEAERRLAICLQCPLRVDLGACTQCYALSGLLKLVDRMVKQFSTRVTDGRRSCGACACYIEAKVCLDKATLRRVDLKLEHIPAYHPDCWMHD